MPIMSPDTRYEIWDNLIDFRLIGVTPPFVKNCTLRRLGEKLRGGLVLYPDRLD
jgi:hypothetical protein